MTAALAELAQLQAIRIVALVLDCRVVAFLAVGTLQGDDGRATFGRSHVSSASQEKDLALCQVKASVPQGRRTYPAQQYAQRHQERPGAGPGSWRCPGWQCR